MRASGIARHQARPGGLEGVRPLLRLVDRDLPEQFGDLERALGCLDLGLRLRYALLELAPATLEFDLDEKLHRHLGQLELAACEAELSLLGVQLRGERFFELYTGEPFVHLRLERSDLGFH